MYISFFKLDFGGGWWSPSHAGSFTPWYTLWSPGLVRRGAKISPLLGFDARTVELVASRYAGPHPRTFITDNVPFSIVYLSRQAKAS